MLIEAEIVSGFNWDCRMCVGIHMIRDGIKTFDSFDES